MTSEQAPAEDAAGENPNAQRTADALAEALAEAQRMRRRRRRKSKSIFAEDETNEDGEG